jgi:hypothetical protein
VIPAPVIEEVGRILVVRDDLVAGGSKRRVIDQILGAGGEFVYASPVYGYAQIALAHACAAAGHRATIFTAARAQLHPRTLEARKAGAKVVQVPVGYMSNVRAKARAYCELSGATLLPFGLDLPAFVSGLAAAARAIPVKPREVWAAAGSGTLIRALQLAWPRAAFHAVRVGAVPDVGRAELHVAPERFEQDARQPPPFPSCSNYDAKVWRFIVEKASPGALFWNVAA